MACGDTAVEVVTGRKLKTPKWTINPLVGGRWGTELHNIAKNKKDKK